MSNEDWGERGKCDHCDAENVPVHRSCDPFLKEVHDETTEESDWCEDCYDRRSEDI